jgi:hypothetical protein
MIGPGRARPGSSGCESPTDADGREQWCADHRIEVAEVERAHGFERGARRLPGPPRQAGRSAQTAAFTAKSTSAVVIVPAARPGAVWYCQ